MQYLTSLENCSHDNCFGDEISSSIVKEYLKAHERKKSHQLQQAGIVLHLARSGRLIVKANSPVREGSILVDKEGRKICKVIETIGPVTSPYLSAQPLTDRIERVMGQELVQSEFIEYRERRNNSFSKPSKNRFTKRGPGTRRQ